MLSHSFLASRLLLFFFLSLLFFFVDKYFLHSCWTYFIIIQGGLDDSGAASVRAIMHWQYRTICRGQKSILQNLCDLLGEKAHDYISFFGLRGYGRLFDGGPLATSQVFLLFVYHLYLSAEYQKSY